MHPILAHFPVALVPIATFFRFADFAFKSRQTYLLPAYRLLLLLAVCGAWAAIFTGQIAEDVVNKVICDPTVTQEHEEYAEILAYLLTFVGVAEIVFYYRLKKFAKPAAVLGAILMLSASGLIAYVGHLGASLVYLQAAGVYHPSEDCKEFE